MTGLVEAVARALCIADGCQPDSDNQVAAPPCALNWQLYEAQAHAAIPVVIEHCAKVADAHKEPQPDGEWWMGWNAACGELAGLFRELDQSMPEGPTPHTGRAG